ncbi:MAG TPA: acetate--CoA ligase family protein, partial [Spirochaetota bacterium]|nr:acetate--CoA ligase family protein [Spirochaetota bacterium]
MREILEQAITKRQKALSEFDSKQLMKMAGIPVSRNYLAKSKEEAIKYAQQLGFPVVLKGCSDTLTHKTELGMVKLKLKTKEDVANAYDEITGKGIPLDGVLVQEWLDGDNREFVLGSIRDPQFGPCVMFGLGGVFTEALQDVSFRVAPITSIDAYEMMDELKTKKLLGAFRGSPAVDKEMLA